VRSKPSSARRTPGPPWPRKNNEALPSRLKISGSRARSNAKKRDLAALEKKSAALSSGPSAAESAERRLLQNEIDQLNREIEQKNKEALILMDL